MVPLLRFLFGKITDLFWEAEGEWNVARLGSCAQGTGVGEAPSAVLTHRTEGLVDSFSQGLGRPHAVSSSVLRGIEPRLKDFHQLLLHPPKVRCAQLLGTCRRGPMGLRPGAAD